MTTRQKRLVQRFTNNRIAKAAHERVQKIPFLYPAYVANVGETFKAPNGEFDARLRVVYSNGTESNLLRRSLQRALYKDETGRRISDPAAGPLFADQSGDDDEASGTIYVLRSKSEHPLVAANRDVLHKIGVTGGDVARRFANAKLDPTFLMADVEIMATYELYNTPRDWISRSRIGLEIRLSRANGFSSCCS